MFGSRYPKKYVALKGKRITSIKHYVCVKITFECQTKIYYETTDLSLVAREKLIPRETYAFSSSFMEYPTTHKYMKESDIVETAKLLPELNKFVEDKILSYKNQHGIDPTYSVEYSRNLTYEHEIESENYIEIVPHY